MNFGVFDDLTREPEKPCSLTDRALKNFRRRFGNFNFQYFLKSSMWLLDWALWSYVSHLRKGDSVTTTSVDSRVLCNDWGERLVVLIQNNSLPVGLALEVMGDQSKLVNFMVKILSGIFLPVNSRLDSKFWKLVTHTVRQDVKCYKNQLKEVESKRRSAYRKIRQ